MSLLRQLHCRTFYLSLDKPPPCRLVQVGASKDSDLATEYSERASGSPFLRVVFTTVGFSDINFQMAAVTLRPAILGGGKLYQQGVGNKCLVQTNRLLPYFNLSFFWV